MKRHLEDIATVMVELEDIVQEEDAFKILRGRWSLLSESLTVVSDFLLVNDAKKLSQFAMPSF